MQSNVFFLVLHVQHRTVNSFESLALENKFAALLSILELAEGEIYTDNITDCLSIVFLCCFWIKFF